MFLLLYIVIIYYVLHLQLYDRRKKMLKSKREKERFQGIDYSYMTEESMSENEDTVRQHKLQWRSDGKKDNIVQSELCA